MNSELTRERLTELLDYNAETGVFVWKTSPNRRIRVGSVAGSDSHGYRQIMIDGKYYLEHRLAWLFIHGKWPKEQIDHINREPSDNRISNLREASQSQNKHNTGRYSNNKSGYKGVYWFKDTGKFAAQIIHNRKKHHLGYFTTAEEAHEAYCKAAEQLHKDFSNVGGHS